MTILTGGLFGMGSGKIGELVFSTRNNQTEVRELRKKYEGSVNKSVLNVRAKLPMLTRFLGLFASFIRIGFPRKPKQRTTAFNAAFSENYNFVVDGAYPNLEIDYSKVTLSKGNLERQKGLNIDRIERQLFNMKWNIDINCGSFSVTNGCDRICCTIYNSVNQIVIRVLPGSMSKDKHFLFCLPEVMAEKKIHTYVFLTSFVKKVISRTQNKCLDLREPKTNEKDRNLRASCRILADKGVKAKEEALRKAAKQLVIPKIIIEKKMSGKVRRYVRGYTRNVLGKEDGVMRKSIHQKRP